MDPKVAAPFPMVAAPSIPKRASFRKAAPASLNLNPVQAASGGAPPSSAFHSPFTKHLSIPGPNPNSDPTTARTTPSLKRTAAFRAGDRASPALKRSSSSVNKINPYELRTDRLGTLVRSLARDLDASGSWTNFVENFRGRPYLAEELDGVDHPAANLLREWRDNGVPVLTSSEPWSQELKDSHVERGCHRSADEHSVFLREEMSEFIDNRFWAVLPYSAVRHLPQLQLSPAAVKEERDRKPRLLCDHSWNPVNENTLPHSPPEAMQFGGALHRVLREVRHANPRYGPVHLCKFDIKDAFYRLSLKAADCPRLAIILPKYDGEEQLIAIPLAATMGWVESPPTCCTMTETIADITNEKTARSPRAAEPHRLEANAAVADNFHTEDEPEPRGSEDQEAALSLSVLYPGEASPQDVLAEESERAPNSNKPFSRPVGSTDVFMDDFILAGQGKASKLRALRRHLLHSVDEVLSRPGLNERRNEAVSLKKLLTGDGSWGTRKLLLGWIVDSARQTIELPPHRKQALHEIFTSLQGLRRISAKKWRSILGKLRFVALAIPGSAGLFSALQWAQNQAGDNRVRLNSFVRSNIDAFGRLAASLCCRPTHLAELVPQEPTLLGATDAAKAGMGGIYFDHTGRGHYWRSAFPTKVQEALVSYDNPGGHITNSDLEQAALLAQVDVMAHSHNIRYASIENFSDNTPAVSRVRKGAVSAPGPASYLCQLASDHQRLHRYLHSAAYIPGPQNAPADDTSRLQQLTNASFHSYFQQQYPLPQAWQPHLLRPEMNSKLISALLCKPQTPLLCPKLGPAAKGSSTTGRNSAPATSAIHPSVTSQIPKRASATYWSTGTESEAGLPQRPASLYALAQWRKPSWRWARGSPHWVSRIPERKFQDQTGTIPYWLLTSTPSQTKTTRTPAPTQRTSPSSNTCTTSSIPLIPSTESSTYTSSTSASSGSSGFFGPRNTSQPTQKAVRRPSAYRTSLSWSATNWSPPLTLL